MTQPDDLSVLTRAARAPDVVLAYGSDVDQVADVRFGAEGAEGRPLVMIIHGGFWRPQYDRAHTGPMAEAICAAGWTVASAEYRRVPGEPDKTLQDVSDALSTLPSRISHHNGKVVLIGHSAGGHLVLWLSAARSTPQLAGTLALAPAADLQLAHELNLGDGATFAFLGVAPKKRPDVDPRRLPSPEVPVTLVHGDRDVVVRLSVAEAYAGAHPNVRLVRLIGVGHFAPIDPLSAVWPTIVDELRILSGSRSPQSPGG
jgi:acetyl esterase/lipase